jgi:hypothetical protein
MVKTKQRNYHAMVTGKQKLTAVSALLAIIETVHEANDEFGDGCPMTPIYLAFTQKGFNANVIDKLICMLVNKELLTMKNFTLYPTAKSAELIAMR